MKKIAFFVIITVVFISLYAQYDSLWAKVDGGAGYDVVTHTLSSFDGNYLMAGYFDTDASGYYDGVFAQYSKVTGDILWKKTYGGSESDILSYIGKTTDNCYLLAGKTKSYGSGADDGWIIKTNSTGDTIWTRAYGNSLQDRFRAVAVVNDTSYLVAGLTQVDSDTTDFWLLNIDGNGDTLWTKTYGGSGSNMLNSMTLTDDGFVILVGRTNSRGAGSYDFYIVKTDLNGDTVWTRTYGGAGWEDPYKAIETDDSCYAIFGVTGSYGAGGGDFWLIKTDMDGNLLWSKTYGGSANDYGFAFCQKSDGGYLLTGETYSFGVTGGNIYLVSTDADGDTLSTRVYGNTGDDVGNSLMRTSDDYYLLAGYTGSYGAGGYDFWFFKLDNMKPDLFSLVQPEHDIISLTSKDCSWHPSYSPKDYYYEFTLNSIGDSLSSADTSMTLSSLAEGYYEWYVTAKSIFGFATESDIRDTFCIDTTAPKVLALEEIEDTNYSGPFDLQLMAEDTLTGIDSIELYYMLPGDTLWSKNMITEKAGLWYTGHIPPVSQTGYVYYYLNLYDMAYPVNSVRNPAYPDLYSFRVTELTGIESKPTVQSSFKIESIDGRIEFALNRESAVNITVFDMLGRTVISRAMNFPVGNHSLNLEIKSGIYFVRVNTPFGSCEKKIVKIK